MSPRAAAGSRRAALLLVACVAVAATSLACDGRFASQAFNGRRIATPVAKPSAKWERVDGRPFRFAEETAGRVTLLYFGYTHCPDVCPTQLAHVAAGLRKLGGDSASRIDVVVVSIDPERDSASVLAQWVQGFHPQFIGLRGSSSSVRDELTRLGLAPPAGADSALYSPDPAHAAAVIAFARDGLGHFMYPPLTNAEAWAYDLRKLLRDSVP